VSGRATVRAVLLAVLSGACLIAAAPARGVPWLLFVSLVPLLLAIDIAGRSSRPPSLPAAAGAGWVAGLVFQAGLFDWLPAAIARLQQMDAARAYAWWALFVGYQALQLALFALGAAMLLRRLRREGGAGRVGVIAAAVGSWWVVVEWAFPVILPWPLGAILGPSRLLRQGADLAGAPGLAGLAVCINALLATACAPAPRRRALVLVTALLVATASYGALRARRADRPRRDGLTVALVQGGGAPATQATPDAVEGDWRRYARLTRRAGRDADLVIWPETALRVYLRDQPALRRRTAALAAALGRPLLLGALDRAGIDREWNSAYLLQSGVPPQVYHKQLLVPFAEYVPALRWAPAGWRTTGVFVTGSGAGAMALGRRLRLALSICVEAVHPGFFGPAVRGGAGLLVNLSDDTWFGSPRAAAQHLELTRLRAVETRRWMVRASGSGISAVVDPAGDVVARLPYGRVDALVYRVGTSGSTPLYSAAGRWFPVAAAGLLLVLALTFPNLALKVCHTRASGISRAVPSQ
jgi:apolipoprotein N-acyltransferase